MQRNKVDTHGMLFNGALSQVMAGVYVLEVTLIGLFFLVRNEQGNVVCSPQAIIMIVALALTGMSVGLIFFRGLCSPMTCSNLSLYPGDNAFSIV